jgi:hypothetical protein
MSDWTAMINGVQPALAGLDMNMPGFLGYVRDESLTHRTGWSSIFAAGHWSAERP